MSAEPFPQKKKKETAGHISQPAPELLDFSFLLQLLIFVPSARGIIMTNKRKQGRCKRCLQGVLSLTLHYSTTNGSFSKRTYFSTYLQQAQSVKASQEISCSSPALCDRIFFLLVTMDLSSYVLTKLLLDKEQVIIQIHNQILHCSRLLLVI